MAYGSYGFTELALALLVYGVVFLTAVFLLYLAVKRGVSDGMQATAGKGTGQAGGVRQILDERYALGEISQEEYERMRREVEGR